MPLGLSDTQQQVQSTVRALLEDRAPLADLNGWEQSPAGFDQRLLADLTNLGLVGLAAPQEVGGGGADLLHAAVVLTELGRMSTPGPYLGMLASIEALRSLGSTPEAKSALAQLARGERLAAAVLATEGTRDLVARPSSDGWLVSGGPVLVEWGLVADLLLLVLPEAGAVLVDTQSPGVTLADVPVLDNTRVARLTLADAPARWVSGTGHGVDDVVAVGGVLRAAEMLGGAGKMLELTLEHVAQREQFGRPLGAFQAVQHHCADAATLLAGGRLAVYECLWRYSRGLSATRQAAVATFHTGRVAERVAVTAAQLHGGIGYIREYPLHHFYRRAMAQRLRLGAVPGQLDRVATEVFGAGAAGCLRLEPPMPRHGEGGDGQD